MRTAVTFYALILCLPLTLKAQDIKESLEHDGRQRTFLVHLPKDYSEEKTYPLVIALHGGSGQAKVFNRGTGFRFNSLADEEGFILVYPQGVGKSWNDHPEREKRGKARKLNIDDVGFISAMIDDLASRYAVDITNVFACGISNGGLMSLTLGADLPEKIKAVGLVSANFSKLKTDEMTDAQPFPVIIIHGTADPIFPYDEGEIRIFRQRRGHVLGAEKSIDFMCALNGNSTEGIITEMENSNGRDGCTSTRIVYPNAERPDLKVELIKIEGGGHTWPGGTQYLGKRLVGNVSRDQNACDLLWNFFKSLQ